MQPDDAHEPLWREAHGRSGSGVNGPDREIHERSHCRDDAVPGDGVWQFGTPGAARARGGTQEGDRCPDNPVHGQFLETLERRQGAGAEHVINADGSIQQGHGRQSGEDRQRTRTESHRHGHLTVADVDVDEL